MTKNRKQRKRETIACKICSPRVVREMKSTGYEKELGDTQRKKKYKQKQYNGAKISDLILIKPRYTYTHDI